MAIYLLHDNTDKYSDQKENNDCTDSVVNVDYEIPSNSFPHQPSVLNLSDSMDEKCSTELT